MKKMNLSGAKIAMLVEDNYQELELWYPLLRLREEGADVVVVGPQKGRIFTSKHGYPVTSDLAADEVEIGSLAGVIVPGGYAPDVMRRHPAMVRLVREANERGIVVAAICHAGWMLVSADVLRGRKATCFFSIKDDVVNAGAEYIDAEVVRDGNLVTSRRRSAAQSSQPSWRRAQPRRCQCSTRPSQTQCCLRGDSLLSAGTGNCLPGGDPAGKTRADCGRVGRTKSNSAP
jgi:protease I